MLITLFKQVRAEIKSNVNEVNNIELSEEERNAKLNKIMSDFTTGNSTLEETLSEMAKLGVTPNVTEDTGKTTLTFEFNDRTYTISQNKKGVELPPSQEPEPETPQILGTRQTPPPVAEPADIEVEEPEIEESDDKEPQKVDTTNYVYSATQQGLHILTEQSKYSLPEGIIPHVKDLDTSKRHVAFDSKGNFYDYNPQSGRYELRTVNSVTTTMAGENKEEFTVTDARMTAVRNNTICV